ncbi:MAG: aspartate 1-decarboxylase [Candidatus Anoxymicrobium japonicum]|uniref:Aspartate 1-decarboxylase n=1 Tax=Candidatus Anoxymicrobium japonicum TaxID=2013648 RepID=A0A2N3G793_9ACTN|nr:MAG: aspartate 1-decarboxylase [Candidatus Anoxymicrobium japonicum]
MYRNMLKCKIHRAVITDADIQYEGSVTIDRRLMDLADLAQYEKVNVWDIDNGARLTTYVIEGTRDSGEICMNGAAARLVHKGDRVIISSFVSVPESRVADHHPKIVFVDDDNRPEMIENHLTVDDFC